MTKHPGDVWNYGTLHVTIYQMNPNSTGFRGEQIKTGFYRTGAGTPWYPMDFHQDYPARLTESDSPRVLPLEKTRKKNLSFLSLAEIKVTFNKVIWHNASFTIITAQMCGLEFSFLHYFFIPSYLLLRSLAIFFVSPLIHMNSQCVGPVQL